MILVTGAGGTVGTALLEELRSSGQKPRVAHRSSDKAARARAAGHDVVVLDLARPETLRPALDGVEAVFLLGAGGLGQVEGEIQVVKEARAAGAKRLVKLSVWRAAEEAFSFAKIHRPIERAVEAAGLAWTLLRPNGFMQNFVNYMAGSIKAQGAIFQPAGDAKISHIDVRDVARVAARALTTSGHEGRAYELSGPSALSYGEAADTLSRVLGKEVRYVAVSDDAAKAGMVSAGMPEFYADYVIDLHRYYRSGAGSAVTSAVKDVTGREPTGFEQFALDHAGAFR
ncbi:SDR family oxidoreductase [Sorangium sp. So ce1078]|uniref:SDR family oxidoreductase n=1 Tax=Sorangium sp. So ce1078 TaxID=3133329 RepID=UPI003F62DA76